MRFFFILSAYILSLAAEYGERGGGVGCGGGVGAGGVRFGGGGGGIVLEKRGRGPAALIAGLEQRNIVAMVVVVVEIDNFGRLR